MVPIATQPTKPSYQVEYNVLDESELTQRQVKEIEHIAGIIGIQGKDAALVLRYFGWNKDLLMERYMVTCPFFAGSISSVTNLLFLCFLL
jgi:ariadne-1